MRTSALLFALSALCFAASIDYVASLNFRIMTKDTSAKRCQQNAPDPKLPSCERGYYCNYKNMQCVHAPQQCDRLQSNVAFYGEEYKTIVRPGLTLGDCCRACDLDRECLLYTFAGPFKDGNSCCYLKNDTNHWKWIVAKGRFSGNKNGGYVEQNPSSD